MQCVFCSWFAVCRVQLLLQLEWLEAAVELAPEEEKGGVERELEGAVLEHDQVTRQCWNMTR